MTKVLIVEDDASQAKLLARAILVRRPEYTVLTAPDGEHATQLLSQEQIDLVLTDLQMPGMNGFDLLAWLVHHRPNLPVFTMTAYGTKETLAQLSAYGSTECFVKPVDIGRVVEQMSESLSQTIRGHVQNLGLASFLQLIEMEKKTCTLNVEHRGRRGTLYVRKGVLIDAKLEDLGGEQAATTILAWSGASIAISSTCPVQRQVIDKPFSYLVMEAMRLQDESARMPVADAVPPDDERTEPDAASAPTHAEALPSETNLEVPALLEVPEPSETYNEPLRAGETDLLAAYASIFPTFEPEPPATIAVPSSALAIAVVDSGTGALLAAGHRRGVRLSELAETAAQLLRQEVFAISALDESERVEELVFTSKLRCELIRPLPEMPGVFLLMVFDPEETTLVMARVELARTLLKLRSIAGEPVW